MDEIVKQAMAKWPNVPHCYGWLALDARGQWRMRDERAQALHLAGDRITNPALLGFINRNYMYDDQGRWYFQNGPQRVYVHLHATPYIAHTDPALGFVLHTGDPLHDIEAVWLTENGQLLFKSAEKIALVDDRDMAQCLALLQVAGQPVNDEQLLAWLERPSSPHSTHALHFVHAGKLLAVQPLAMKQIATAFGFVAAPQPD